MRVVGAGRPGGYARVLWLLPGGAADRAGVRVGDQITHWDGLGTAHTTVLERAGVTQQTGVDVARPQHWPTLPSRTSPPLSSRATATSSASTFSAAAGQAAHGTKLRKPEQNFH